MPAVPSLKMQFRQAVHMTRVFALLAVSPCRCLLCISVHEESYSLIVVGVHAQNFGRVLLSRLRKECAIQMRQIGCAASLAVRVLRGMTLVEFMLKMDLGFSCRRAAIATVLIWWTHVVTSHSVTFRKFPIQALIPMIVGVRCSFQAIADTCFLKTFVSCYI